eukprot:CAMPEP_0172702078 /NCGR_PEP_ID=MMETSP1074-20121228/33206_1 /TAXON_ID=2916 /ORGANISM="Ceratium fusus, Strain PA161109" /LENGTH=35 /DNA_ID= /DNA_START= /DNA_END= /DNA_ORIENTATION=
MAPETHTMPRVTVVLSHAAAWSPATAPRSAATPGS